MAGSKRTTRGRSQAGKKDGGDAVSGKEIMSSVIASAINDADRKTPVASKKLDDMIGEYLDVPECGSIDEITLEHERSQQIYRDITNRADAATQSVHRLLNKARARMNRTRLLLNQAQLQQSDGKVQAAGPEPEAAG